MLVDADNLDSARLRLVAAELVAAELSGAAVTPGARVVVAGRAARLATADWPATATLLEAAGWQRADSVLAQAYVTDDRPLVLVTGDGDFALLAERHAGPVLVVGTAGSTSARLRRVATVVDPVHDGVERLRSWLAVPPSAQG